MTTGMSRSVLVWYLSYSGHIFVILGHRRLFSAGEATLAVALNLSASTWT